MRFDPARLRQAREAAVRTFEEIAVACGVSSMTVRNWEAGKGEPDAGDLGKIAAVCGRPLAYFYEKEAKVSR